ncbi:MAG: resolvase [Proteobacteria bacterium]|nr:resolvase [Pseudomonadota bacterium]
MLIGYARVSTEDQHLTPQQAALKGAGCERIYEEKLSGAQRARPELNRLLDQLRAGDVVVVSRLDRLAEFERELIHERTRSGRVAARARGVRFGRPAKLTGDQLTLAERLIGEGRSIPAVAKLLKVHRATLYRALAATA